MNGDCNLRSTRVRSRVRRRRPMLGCGCLALAVLILFLFGHRWLFCVCSSGTLVVIGIFLITAK